MKALTDVSWAPRFDYQFEIVRVSAGADGGEHVILKDIPAPIYWVWGSLPHSHLGQLVYYAALAREVDSTWAHVGAPFQLTSPFRTAIWEDRGGRMPVRLDVVVPLEGKHLIWDLQHFFAAAVSGLVDPLSLLPSLG